MQVTVPAGCSAGLECNDSGVVTTVSRDSCLEQTVVGRCLFTISGEPVEKTEKLHDSLRRVQRSGEDYELTFVQPVFETLLGRGIPLPRCQGGAPHLYVMASAGNSCKGTVLLLHGSGREDWLGNQDPSGKPTVGGVTEMAFKFREMGFTAAVLDSYAAGRRDENFKTIMRVDDIMSALEYAKEASLPEPFHIYGKSNGGYSLAKFLELPAEDSEDAIRAKRLMATLASVIIQCPYLNHCTDVANLRQVVEDCDVNLPDVLFLLAEEDKMLVEHRQPVDVGVQAAEAIAGQLIIEGQEDVMKGTEVLSKCSLQQGGGADTGRPYVEVRTYSDIGHTFVADAQGGPISDVDCKPVVEHALDAAVSFLCAQDESTNEEENDTALQGAGSTKRQRVQQDDSCS